MTYDERQEIEQYLDIIRRNCQRLLHSIDLMQSALGEMKCATNDGKEDESAKENFLKHY